MAYVCPHAKTPIKTHCEIREAAAKIPLVVSMRRMQNQFTVTFGTIFESFTHPVAECCSWYCFAVQRMGISSLSNHEADSEATHGAFMTSESLSDFTSNFMSCLRTRSS